MSLITDEHIDIVKEIVNIGVGKAANLLNHLINENIKLSVPNIYFTNTNELPKFLMKYQDVSISVVNLGFKGELSGSCQLLFATDGAKLLVSIFTDEDITDEDEFNEIRQHTLSEIGNIVLNSLIGTISNILSQKFLYRTPKYIECSVANFLSENDIVEVQDVMLATTRFIIQEANITGEFLLIFETGSMDTLIEKIELVNQKGTL
ncbi:MAG TPA: chemotaxis protein CheC [Candidatus Kapabacteria bacterium]|nr:chemotaxis protein CheC [Candidatus Kapabacteria bacterium]